MIVLRHAARAAAAAAASRARCAAASSSSCLLASDIAKNRRILLLGGGRFFSSQPLGLGKRGLSDDDDSRSFYDTTEDKIADPEPLHNSGPESNSEQGKVKRVEFVAEEKDIESDVALWALYERWCKAFRQERDRDEMLRRFEYFKNCVLLVDRTNKESIRNGDPCTLELNKFADGKLVEQQQFKDPFHSYFEDWPYAEPGTVIYGTTTQYISGETDISDTDSESQ